jgi:hypothetical protein
VSGLADDELKWEPVVGSPRPAGDLASVAADADRLPVVHGMRDNSRVESAFADTTAGPGRGLNRGDLVRGLVRLGVPNLRSSQLIDAAIADLQPREITEAGVLRRALASL